MTDTSKEWCKALANSLRATLSSHDSYDAADLIDALRSELDQHDAHARAAVRKGFERVITILDTEERDLQRYIDDFCQGVDAVTSHARTVAEARLSEVGVIRRALAAAFDKGDHHG